MKIRPLADRLVVKRLEQEQKTKGGIIIPDSAKEKPVEGVVVGLTVVVVTLMVVTGGAAPMARYGTVVVVVGDERVG